MTLEAFSPVHLQEIEVQPAQRLSRARAPASYGEVLAAAGPAQTLRYRDRIIACYGIGRPAPDERLLWCYIATAAPLLPIYRAVKLFLVEHSQQPVYSTAEVGFAEAERALELLGFVRDEPLKAFGFDGEDHTLFVRAA